MAARLPGWPALSVPSAQILQGLTCPGLSQCPRLGPVGKICGFSVCTRGCADKNTDPKWFQGNAFPNLPLSDVVLPKFTRQHPLARARTPARKAPCFPGPSHDGPPLTSIKAPLSHLECSQAALPLIQTRQGTKQRIDSKY